MRTKDFFLLDLFSLKNDGFGEGEIFILEQKYSRERPAHDGKIGKLASCEFYTYFTRCKRRSLAVKMTMDTTRIILREDWSKFELFVSALF